MYEIEIKFKVKDKEKLLNKLKDDFNCSFSNTKTQEDVVFLPVDKATYPVPAGLSVIRIRNENNKKKTATLKQKQTNRVAAKEIEFVIGSTKQFSEFLEAINYKEVVRISKKRINTKYKDFNICVDEVKKLGTIIEIEKLSKNKDDIEIIEKEICDFASLLEINIEDKINNRYDTIIYNIDHPV